MNSLPWRRPRKSCPRRNAKPDTGKKAKPRTYREKARKDYLFVEKLRKKHKNTIRKAIKKQLGYVKRNLDIVSRYLKESSRYELLSPRQKKQYETKGGEQF